MIQPDRLEVELAWVEGKWEEKGLIDVLVRGEDVLREKEMGGTCVIDTVWGHGGS